MKATLGNYVSANILYLPENAEELKSELENDVGVKSVSALNRIAYVLKLLHLISVAKNSKQINIILAAYSKSL